MKKINHEELEEVSYHYAKKKMPIIVLGRTGIGKSVSIKNTAKRMAEERNKVLVDMGDINKEMFEKICKEPDNYYIYKVYSMSTIGDPTDIKGLPFTEDSEILKTRVVKWLKNEWIALFERCSGTIFFDEFNLAPPSIQAITYQILLDRRIDDFKFNEDVAIFCAGNLTEDRAGVYEIPKPIRTRTGVYELTCPTEKELTSFAIKNGWDNRVISYINAFPSRIFVENEKTEDILCPRGLGAVSTLINGIDNKELETLHLYSSGIMGEGMALEFMSFIKLFEKIPTPEAILSKKAKIPEGTDLKYACISAITEYFRQQKEKDRAEVIKKIVDLKDNLEPEFHILALRLCKGIDNNILKTLKGTPYFKKLESYEKYMVD